MRRERRWARSTGPRCAARARALLDDPRQPRPRHRRAGRRASRWPTASASRSPRRCRRTPRVLIMDEPTAALAEADVRRLMDVVRRLRDARRRHRLYQPPHAGDLRARRPRHRAARRRATSAPRTIGEVDESQLVSMMVGRVDRPALPEGRGDDRRRRSSNSRNVSYRDDGRGHLLHAARRRDPRHRRAGRLGPHRDWRSPSSASRRRPPARSCSTASR